MPGKCNTLLICPYHPSTFLYIYLPLQLCSLGSSWRLSSYAMEVPILCLGCFYFRYHYKLYRSIRLGNWGLLVVLKEVKWGMTVVIIAWISSTLCPCFFNGHHYYAYWQEDVVNCIMFGCYLFVSWWEIEKYLCTWMG